ncbi:hypothetical protein BJY04DRAFT_176539, partial [Aspergillus karnatakaensis]|uniref:uncharacterized protein n=1 Tax=Aspergillus karnatakaensis TaxID=1810916 RepID=UPI003CCD42EA
MEHRIAKPHHHRNEHSKSYKPIPHLSEGRYMDPRKLVHLLRKEHGVSNFRVVLQRDQYMIHVDYGTSCLSDAEIDKCRV